MVELTPIQKKVVEYILTHIEKTGIPPTLREISSHFQWKAVGSAQDVVAALRKKGVLLSSSPGKARQIVPAPEIFGGLFSPEIELAAMEAEQADTINTNQEFHQKSSRKSRKFTFDLPPKQGQVLPGFEDFLRIPLLGQVQAGLPLEAVENVEDYAIFPPVSRGSLRGGALFALTIEGYSMLNAGFLPGDTILVEQTTKANDRDIVVAKINYTEVTVKRFAQKGSSLYKVAQTLLKNQNLPPAYLIPENPDFSPIPFGTQEEDKLVGIVRSLFRKTVL